MILKFVEVIGFHMCSNLSNLRVIRLMAGLVIDSCDKSIVLSFNWVGVIRAQIMLRWLWYYSHTMVIQKHHYNLYHLIAQLVNHHGRYYIDSIVDLLCFGEVWGLPSKIWQLESKLALYSPLRSLQQWSNLVVESLFLHSLICPDCFLCQWMSASILGVRGLATILDCSVGEPQATFDIWSSNYKIVESLLSVCCYRWGFLST